MAGLRRSPRNFRTYAALEASNILVLPGAALLLAPPIHSAEVVAMALAIAAASGFLLVGTAYWWALDRRLKGAGRKPVRKALVFADRVEVPFLALTTAAAASLVYALWLHGWTSAVIAAGLLTLLAALEYVNYYYRQLQHFDRWSDFKGLVTTGRLRCSHMGRALAAHRKSQSRLSSRNGSTRRLPTA